MPTYDFRCDQCDHAFEEFQQVSEPKLDRCPGCDATGLVRLIGAGQDPVIRGGTPKFFGQNPS
jgi:putative FmdB family regulatory protein